MDIRGLGYIGIDVADVASWRDYGELLGTMVVPEETGLRLKIDDRPFRVVVQPTEGSEGLAFAGWEVGDAAALETAFAELEKAGCSIEVASIAECADRCVRELLRTTDPSGFTVELFHGSIHDHRPFVSPAGVSGFVTGLAPCRD